MYPRVSKFLIKEIKMTRKKLLMLLGSLALALVLAVPFVAACAAPTPTPTPTQAPERISVAAWPVEWGAYASAIAMADVVNQNSHIDLVIEAIGGSPSIVEAVATGYAPFGITELVPVVEAYTGTSIYADKPWAPAENLRAIMTVETFDFGLLTAGSTGVKTIDDLRGKTIAEFAWQGTRFQYLALLKAHGLDLEKDVDIIMLNNAAEGWEQIKLGNLSVVWDVINIEQLGTQEDFGEIVFLPMDPVAIEKAIAADPISFAAVTLGTMGVGDIPGLRMTEDVVTIVFRSLLIGNQNLSDDAAYTITMTLLENYQTVQSIAFATRHFSLETAAPVLPQMPYHSGAIRAYKEMGIWTAAHEAAQQTFG